MLRGKKDGTKKAGYGALPVFAKAASPVFLALYFVFLAGILLSGIIALIVLFVNTPVEKTLLPPLMTLHGKEYYSLSIGNGIVIDAPYASVSLADIKIVIWAELIMCAASFCMLAPVCLNLSRLLKNVASDNLYAPENAKYTFYTGVSVMIGYTVLLTARRFYNYLLVKTFVSEPDAIRLSLGFDAGGIAVGLLIILLGCVIGRVCETRELVRTGSDENDQM